MGEMKCENGSSSMSGRSLVGEASGSGNSTHGGKEKGLWELRRWDGIADRRFVTEHRKLEQRLSSDRLILGSTLTKAAWAWVVAFRPGSRPVNRNRNSVRNGGGQRKDADAESTLGVRGEERGGGLAESGSAIIYA